MSALMVIVAAVVNFIIGAIWYGALSAQWQDAWNLDSETLQKKDAKPYLIAFIGSLWTAYGLFLAIKHIKPQSIDEMLAIAFGTWLFICVGTGAKHYAFAGVNGKAFAIDYGVDLIGIVVMCFLISL
jgi:hypothetical protein